MAQSIKATVWRDTIETAVGTTFTNRLVLHSVGTEPQLITLSVQLPKSVQLLSVLPATRVLLPGQPVMIPIKGLLNGQASIPTSRISIQVQDTTGRLLETASFVLAVPQKNQPPVSLYTPNETILLYSGAESARLPLRITHTGPRRASYTIDITSIPDGIDRTRMPFAIDLAPGQDTTLTIVANPARYWSVSAPYELVLTVRDAQQSVVGSVVYKLVIAVDSKRYIAPDVGARGGYGVNAGITKLSDGHLAREFRVWGSDSVGKAQVDFQLQYLDYTASQYRQLQNAYITRSTRRSLVKLGSSYDFHELSLVGRGLKVMLVQPDHQWTFWAINSNPNWLDASMNARTGTMISARYDQRLMTLPGAAWSVSSSYYTQAYSARMGYLNFASFRYAQPRRHSLEVLGGQSVEFARQGTNPARTYGFAGQANYSFVGDGLSWQLRTYVSSPVYAGMQKGATLINGQFVWQITGSTTLVSRLNLAQYNQRWFTSPADYYQRKFGSTVAEVSLSQQLGSFTLGVRPYWYAQTDFTIPSGQQADSYRLAPSVTYQRRAWQHIDISYDTGLMHDRGTASDGPGFRGQRIISSVVMGRFSFWGYWQKGPYYLLDLQNKQPDRILTASLTPMLDFSLLNQRLTGSAGVNYLYDATSTKSRYVAIGRIQYEVTPNLTLRLAGYGTPYSLRPDLSFSQYRLDVTKRFSPGGLGHRGQLQLSFFEDANGNGSKESGERWMDSLLVTINENTLFTNARGTITYRNLPPGTYAISAISAGRVGDPMLYQEKLTIGRSLTKLVPLARTFRVSGQLRCQISTYDRQPCQFNRFVIDIQRQEQTISSTSPLPDGTFAVHLSPGTYTLLVQDYGRQQQPTVHTASFTVTETGQYPTLGWAVDASARPVDVKRFKPR